MNNTDFIKLILFSIAEYKKK